MQGMEPGANLSQSQVLSQRVMNDCNSEDNDKMVQIFKIGLTSGSGEGMSKSMDQGEDCVDPDFCSSKVITPSSAAR